ncbi:MAG: protein-L-isoaspartate(D-aspartate) O-methyltransferase [candidate division Zixibacteria bacterium]|nr:protein-L-isoaspartate(D-aspartate) O-methyltransferase [Candidatus Tariuqbacter arcticus]
MVEKQIVGRGITDARVIEAMKKVPRHLFLNPAMHHNAYSDNALPIEENQTISQPYIVALMTQSLQLTGKEKVLEIGAGSGYQAAILAELCRRVFTIERIPALAKKARERLESLGYTNVAVLTGDGTLGRVEFAPYDRIIITAAAPDIPGGLLKQLSDNGCLVAPVGGRDFQTLRIIQKEGGELSEHDLIGCAFVPLIGKNGWKN